MRYLWHNASTDHSSREQLEWELRRRNDDVGLRRLARLLIDDGLSTSIWCSHCRYVCALERSIVDDVIKSDKVTLFSPLHVPLLWGHERAQLLAADCAERVLPIFEHHRPSDRRPRRAIEVRRAFAKGEANFAAWAAAWAAASPAAREAANAAAMGAPSAAARSAASVTAWDAARAAARAAARDASTDEAWAAAWDAERDWQTERLLEYLLGEVDMEGNS